MSRYRDVFLLVYRTADEDFFDPYIEAFSDQSRVVERAQEIEAQLEGRLNYLFVTHKYVDFVGQEHEQTEQ